MLSSAEVEFREVLIEHPSLRPTAKAQHMLGHPLIVAGPARSGKTGKLLGFYRTALAKGIPGRSAAGDVPGQVAGIGQTLWMAPTARAAAFVRESLLSPGFAACFQPNVYTFEAFAQAILDHAPDVVRPLYGMARRQLIARLADDLRRSGKLAYFAAIADTPGFVDLLSGFLSEMKRHEIWPEAFRDACQRRGITQKDMELFEFYEAYQAVLNKRQLFDAEGRFWTARTLLQEGHRRPFERLRLVVVDGFADFTATQHDILAILAEHADDFVVSLPLERDTESRGDLFAKPRRRLKCCPAGCRRSASSGRIERTIRIGLRWTDWSDTCSAIRGRSCPYSR